MSQTDETQAAVEQAPEVQEEPQAAAPGPSRLVLKRNNVETEEVFLFVPPAVVGRFDPTSGPIDVDLGSLPEGGYISRKHAKITLEDGRFLLTDLGSSNGTYVYRASLSDFERIDTTELADGDEVALGNARFVFHTS